MTSTKLASKKKPSQNMIISKTPVRISFFGGGTDYPAYYNRNKGAVLGSSIDQFTYVSVRNLPPFFPHRIKVGYSKTELVRCIEEIEHPSVKACLLHKKQDNVEVQIFSDLPAKTGLGSSSSFTVGFLNALHALDGKKISKKDLAAEACFIEQEIIKENVGSQDQYHTAFGGFNIIEFSSSEISIRPLIITPEKIKQLEESTLLFYTGITRFASDIVKEQIVKTEKKDNDDYLNSMYNMVFDAEKIISEKAPNNMVKELGSMLDASWQLKKKLSSQISNPFIDELYSASMQLGAYGGKILGAGSGGFLAIIAPKEKHDAIKNSINLLNVDFAFENKGSEIIYMKN